MISFECDYNNGAHPQVLANLIKYNDAKPTPYGFDEYSERAKQKIQYDHADTSPFFCCLRKLR